MNSFKRCYQFNALFKIKSGFIRSWRTNLNQNLFHNPHSTCINITTLQYTMLLVIRKIIKDQYVFWFWQLSLENWICQRASITTKDDTKTMELTNLVGKKSCYSAQGPRPLSKSKHKVLRTRVCINLWISILVYVMPYNAKIFNWEHILCIKIHACTKRYLIYV